MVKKTSTRRARADSAEAGVSPETEASMLRIQLAQLRERFDACMASNLRMQESLNRRDKKAQLRSFLTIELGDSMVLLLDAAGQPIKRIPLNERWAREVGKVMAARNTKDFRFAPSAHALFTIAEAGLETKATLRDEYGLNDGKGATVTDGAAGAQAPERPQTDRF